MRFAVFTILIVVSLPATAWSNQEDDCLNKRRLQILQISLETPIFFPQELTNDNTVSSTPHVPITAPQTEEANCPTQTVYHPLCIPNVTSLTDDSLRSSLPQLINKRVVSMGEGDAGLVDFLRRRGVSAFGVDIDDSYRRLRSPLRVYQ